MYFFFFFNDTATTEIYTLSLHDALPIFGPLSLTAAAWLEVEQSLTFKPVHFHGRAWLRSEEHTSELQSRQYLVCRLLLEKKKKAPTRHHTVEAHQPLPAVDAAVPTGRDP